MLDLRPSAFLLLRQLLVSGEFFPLLDMEDWFLFVSTPSVCSGVSGTKNLPRKCLRNEEPKPREGGVDEFS